MTQRTTINRRQLLGGAGAAGAALLLGGGGRAGALAVPRSPLRRTVGSALTGDLELWMDIGGDANQQYFLENVIGGFEADNAGITVDVTFHQGADLRQLVQTALAAGEGPDIVRGPSATQTINWARTGVLVDLSAYREEFGWDEQLASWAMDAFTFDGKLYALPMRVDTLLLYYNSTLFADKGWPTPTNLAELEALAEEIEGQGITPFGASNTNWRAASEWHMSVFWNQYAGPEAVRQALTGEIPWTEPVFVEAVELLKSYFDRGWFGGGVDNYFAVPADEIGANFGSGNVAMVPQGVWWMSAVPAFFGEAAGNENEWDWMPWPALGDGVPYPSYPLGIGGSLSINAASDQPDVAAQYLKWYYGDREAALQRMADVAATYNIPIQFEDSELPDNADPRHARVLSETNKAMAAGTFGFVTWTWWGPRANTYVYEGFDQVLVGDVSPAEYCETMQGIFAEELAAGETPTIIAA
jgi:raffinose/stachyose/melibiose transport system substrate-binding protein